MNTIYFNTEAQVNYKDKDPSIETFYYAIYLLISSCASFNEYYSSHKKTVDIKLEKNIKQLKSKKNLTENEIYNYLKLITSPVKDLHSRIVLKNDNKTIIHNFGKKTKFQYSKQFYKKKNDNSFISLDNTSEITCNLLDNNTVIGNSFYAIPVIHNNTLLYKIAVNQNKHIKSFYYENHNYNAISSYQKEFGIQSYWQIPGFNWKYYEQIMDCICKEAKQSSNKKIIFLNCRNNIGGNPSRYYEMVFNLLGIKEYFEREKKKSINERGILSGKVLLSYPISESILKMKPNIISSDEKIFFDYWQNIYNQYINNGEFNWYEDNIKSEWEVNKNFYKDIKYDGHIIISINNTTESWGELLYDFKKINFIIQKYY